MYKKLRFNEGWLKAAAFALVAAAVVVPILSVSASSDNSNDVIWGGCSTKQACLNDLNNGDGHNTAADIRDIYNHYNVGEGSFFNSSSAVPVTVQKNGNIIIDENYGTWKSGDVIATNAWSVGRQNIGESQKVTFKGDVDGKTVTVYQRSTQTSFVSSSIGGWAEMAGDTFHYYVLNACGNVGGATPKPTPPAKSTPKPTPKPTPVPTHSPKPTPVPTYTPKPTPTLVLVSSEVECTALTATPMAGNPDEFTFTIDQSPEQSADVTGYVFTINDTINHTSEAIPTGPDMPSTVQPLTPSDYTIFGQIETTSSTTTQSQECSANISIATAATPTPTPTPTGQVLSANTAPLPATGAETSAFAGALGLTGLGAASRAYLRSRKSLLDSLRRKR